MPCQSDYLAASGQEQESQRTCRLLLYLYNELDYSPIPPWIRNGAASYYGDVKRIDESTAMLCECCRSLSPEEVEKHIYDARSKVARELAGWWERHQEWDKRRVGEENKAQEKEALKSQALKKLTPEEIEALGLH